MGRKKTESKICFKCEKNPRIPNKAYCRPCKSKMDLEGYHKYNKKRREYQKSYNLLHPEKETSRREQSVKWRKNNPGYGYRWYKEKAKYRIDYKIGHNLRERIRAAIISKKGKKSLKTVYLLGCSVDYFKNYIEKLWDNKMNWENYGLKGWHVDHIIPVSKFDLTKEEEQLKCFHYTNLQPLWWGDNLRKSNKIL